MIRPDVGPAEPADPVDPVDPGGEPGQTTTSLTPEPTDPVDPTEPTHVDPAGSNDSGGPGSTEVNDQNGQVQGLEDTQGAIRPVSDDGALPRTGTDQRVLWLLGAGTLGLGVLMTGAGRRLAIVRR